MIHPPVRSRRILVVAAALATASALALSGCGAAADTAEDDASAVALLPEAEGTTEYPLTITTAIGETVIDERPQRVVMASSWDADLFAALG